jgi:hypothetical protein
MKSFYSAMLVMVLVSGPGGSARGDDNDARVILDKAIRALGGETKLQSAQAIAWRARGKSTSDGDNSTFTNETTVQGLDRFRMEWEDEMNGTFVKGLVVVNGDKGWRKYGDNFRELDASRLANHKRSIYLLVVPVLLVPLKGNAFLITRDGEEKVDGKPALGIHVVGPDGKEFTLYFDKESGLPVKLVAKVPGFQGQESTQETIFRDYKDFDGLKKATRLERRRDGEKVLEQEITEFKVLEKVPPEVFAEPQ